MHNSTTARSTAQTIYIAQAPNGMWHWHRRTAGRILTSTERYADELAALHAAADVANTTPGAKLRVTAWQQARIVVYWLEKGAAAFRGGIAFDNLAGMFVRRGWMQEAQAEAVRREADSKPGLDDALPVLTLEEALDIQIAVLNNRIESNNAILAGMGVR